MSPYLAGWYFLMCRKKYYDYHWKEWIQWKSTENEPRCERHGNSEPSHKEKGKGQGNCHKPLLCYVVSGSVCYDLQVYDKMLELQENCSLKKHDMILLKKFTKLFNQPKRIFWAIAKYILHDYI